MKSQSILNHIVPLTAVAALAMVLAAQLRFQDYNSRELSAISEADDAVTRMAIATDARLDESLARQHANKPPVVNSTARLLPPVPVNLQ